MAFHETINNIPFGGELKSSEINGILNNIHENTLELRRDSNSLSDDVKKNANDLDVHNKDPNAHGGLLTSAGDATVEKVKDHNTDALAHSAIRQRVEAVSQSVETVSSSVAEVTRRVETVATRKLIATFVSSGTFTRATYGLTADDEIDAYLVPGGGGGDKGAGGGGGYCKLIRGYKLTAASYSVVIGQGGAPGSPGGNTTAFGVTAQGGSPAVGENGGDGGSGGGGGGGTIGAAGWGGSHGGAGSNASADKLGGFGGGNLIYSPVNPYDGIPYGCGGSTTNNAGGGSGGRAGEGSSAPNNIGKKGGLGGGGGGGSTNGVGGDGGLGGGGGGGGSTGGGGGGNGLVYIYAVTDNISADTRFDTSWTTANNYNVTIPLPRVAGTAFFIRFHAANTTTQPYLNISGTGNLRLYILSAGANVDPTVGQIAAGAVHLVEYTGSAYRIVTL